MKQLIFICLLISSIAPRLMGEVPPRPSIKEEPKEPPQVSKGERVEVPDVGFSIIPPHSWMVSKNSHGSSLLFEAPKQVNQSYQPTIQIMVFSKLRYIDEVTMKEYGDLIVEKFGKISNRVTSYRLRDAAIQRLETGDPAILYYTEFQYDDVPIMQMHILLSSATHHFLMSYTDIAKVFEDESSPGLAIAYTSMHSAQVASKPPWRWRGLTITLGAVFLMIFAWFTMRFMRARRVTKLGQRIEDEDHKEITSDEESQYYSRHAPATQAESHVGDDWNVAKSQARSSAPNNKLSRVQSSHFDEDDEPEVSEVVPISALEKSLHPGRKRRQEQNVAPRQQAPAMPQSAPQQPIAQNQTFAPQPPIVPAEPFVPQQPMSQSPQPLAQAPTHAPQQTTTHHQQAGQAWPQQPISNHQPVSHHQAPQLQPQPPSAPAYGSQPAMHGQPMASQPRMPEHAQQPPMMAYAPTPQHTQHPQGSPTEQPSAQNQSMPMAAQQGWTDPHAAAQQQAKSQPPAPIIPQGVPTQSAQQQPLQSPDMSPQQQTAMPESHPSQSTQVPIPGHQPEMQPVMPQPVPYAQTISSPSMGHPVSAPESLSGFVPTSHNQTPVSEQPVYVQQAYAPASKPAYNAQTGVPTSVQTAQSFAPPPQVAAPAIPEFSPSDEPMMEQPVTASRQPHSQKMKKQPRTHEIDDEPEMTEEARLSEILPKAGTIEKSKPKRKGLFWRKKADDDDKDEGSDDKDSWQMAAAKKSSPRKVKNEDDDEVDTGDQWAVEPSKNSDRHQIAVKDDDDGEESEAWAPEETKRSDPRRNSLLNETEGPQRLIGRAPQGPVTKANNAAVTEDGWNLSVQVTPDPDDEDDEEVG